MYSNAQSQELLKVDKKNIFRGSLALMFLGIFLIFPANMMINKDYRFYSNIVPAIYIISAFLGFYAAKSDKRKGIIYYKKRFWFY